MGGYKFTHNKFRLTLLAALLAAPVSAGGPLTLIINGNEYCDLVGNLEFVPDSNEVRVTVTGCVTDAIHADRFENTKNFRNR